MDKLIQISEFGYIYTKPKHSKYLSQVVNEKTFEEIASIATSLSDFLQFPNDNKTIQAKNFVGTIRTQSGLTIEIYPKVTSENEISKAQQLLLKLLSLLHNLPPYKTFHMQSLKESATLLELFISIFLDEVRSIVQKGLKSDYIQHERNNPFLKGKLLISKQIKHNFAHQERFFVRYARYHLNRKENRLLKSALLFLRNISKDYTNVRRIQEALIHFGQVTPSQNPLVDFKHLHLKRDMRHYRYALEWAKLFLSSKSSHVYSGQREFIAILFPMEKLFERFVEWYFQKEGFTIQRQKAKEFVKSPRILARPDIIATDQDGQKYLIDAKWKLITDYDHISQSDLYQMFAYSTLFGIDNLKLCYPKFEAIKDMEFEYFDGKRLKVCFLDLEEILS